MIGVTNRWALVDQPRCHRARRQLGATHREIPWRRRFQLVPRLGIEAPREPGLRRGHVASVAEKTILSAACQIRAKSRTTTGWSGVVGAVSEYAITGAALGARSAGAEYPIGPRRSIRQGIR